MTTDTVARTLESWELTTVPIRPCEADLLYMTDRMTKRFKNPRVLILGMTPELIDMAHSAGASRIVVMELRSLGLEAYSRLVKNSFESINGDWREHQPACDQAFDIVLGHGSFIFLSFPDDWIKTLSVVRRYLAPGGALIVRHFHVPSRGYPFPDHYERLMHAFDVTTRGMGAEARDREFIKTVTCLRCSAILGATRSDGVVDQIELDRLMALAKEDLQRRHGGEKVWTLMRDEFDYPTAAGYGSVRPLAAPSLEQVRPVWEKGGVRIDDVTMIGDLPVPGSFSFITGGFEPG